MSEKPTPAIRYLSLGWGVQSFTLAAMMALGEIPRVDVAVHADTTHEFTGTYDFARRWTPWLGERGIKVVTVQESSTEILYPNSGGKKQYSVNPPAFTVRLSDLKRGQMKRQCTKSWKIRPANRYVRSLLPGGRPYPGAIEAHIGISLDEWHRMRTNKLKYIVNVYPLVDRRISRADCVDWLNRHGLEVPPKSACVFCPFHSRDLWKELKLKGGTDWEYAMAADEAIRPARAHEGFDLFIHPGCKPLAEAVTLPEDHGAEQLEMDMPCDGGVCFV